MNSNDPNDPTREKIRPARPAVRRTAAAAVVLLLVGAVLWSRSGQFDKVWDSDAGASAPGRTSEYSASRFPEPAPAPTRLIADGKVYAQWESWMTELGLPQYARADGLGDSVALEAADGGPSRPEMRARRYRPALYGESVLAVSSGEKGETWTLFPFENFEVCEKNGDMAGADYWTVYGVRAADDLRALEITDPDQTLRTVTDRASLDRFYAEFSELVFSQAAFDRLMGLDAASGGAASPLTEGQSAAYEGDPRFGDGFTVTVVFQNGLRRDFSYFPRLPLFGRWTVSESFAALLGELTANAGEPERGEAAAKPPIAQSHEPPGTPDV